jgi:hypothetical protein
MEPVRFSIKTENLEIPLDAAKSVRETRNGLTIEVASPCLGVAHKLAADFSLALEYGAAPAAQARMIEAVQEAERRGQPLSCVLSFGS